MNKMELIAVLKDECKITKQEAAQVVETFFDEHGRCIGERGSGGNPGDCVFSM